MDKVIRWIIFWWFLGPFYLYKRYVFKNLDQKKSRYFSAGASIITVLIILVIIGTLIK